MSLASPSAVARRWRFRASCALLLVGACGGPQDPGKLGATCFRDDDCKAGLICVAPTGETDRVCSDDPTPLISNVDGPPVIDTGGAAAVGGAPAVAGGGMAPVAGTGAVAGSSSAGSSSAGSANAGSATGGSEAGGSSATGGTGGSGAAAGTGGSDAAGTGGSSAAGTGGSEPLGGAPI